MKKLIFIVSVLCFGIANADPQIIMCPLTISCNYQKGICNSPIGWGLQAYGTEPFYMETIKLSSIKGITSNNYAELNCLYKYGKTSYFELYTGSNVGLTNLTGSQWVYSGFGNHNATCSDISDLTQCAGEVGG